MTANRGGTMFMGIFGQPPAFCVLVGLGFCAVIGSPAVAEDDAGAASRRELAKFEAEIKPLLKARCFECHNEKEQEGGVDFARLTSLDAAQAQRKLWKRSVRRVQAGEMPPEDATPLTAAEKLALVRWMTTAAEYLDCNPALRDPGPTTLRRLSRTEYGNTVRDLLHLPREVIDALGLPEENTGDQFENQAALLSLAPAVMERYFLAADKLVEVLYSDRWYAGGARQKLFQPKPNDKLPEADAARQTIARLLRRAYRRPAAAEDLARMIGFYTRAKDAGASYEDALRAVLKPILVSPQFLLRVEQDRTAGETSPGVAVDDHEFAVRLSYFLGATMPDDALAKAADEGKLSDPVVRSEHIRRLLSAEQGRSLTDQFAIPWLQLKRLHQARPSQEFFPEFNGQLKQAMLDEVTGFLENMRKEDRSILELLDADYTFANASLAKLYQVEGVTGDKPQRISLQPEHHRGGLLGMGAVLAVTSHTFRTAPTQRGKYVLEVLLGDPPPAPPMNVGSIADDAPNKKDPTTFKEKLAQHATQAACAACHKKIDPLGFALDNYNAIGAWRESTPDRPLDVAGELPGGVKVNGAADLKRVLLSRKDEFARAMVEKMLSYALGRELDAVDECSVREIVARLQQNEYRFSALVTGIVESVPFRQRRRGTAD